MKFCLRVIFAVVVAGVLTPGAAWAQRTDNGLPVLPGPQHLLGAPIFSQALGSNAVPNMPDRLLRNGTPSTCGGPKSFPGLNGGADYAYVAVNWVNGGPARCVTFASILTAVSGGGNQTGIFMAAYDASFNPLDLSQGYLGDTGSSPAGVGLNATMGINLSAGQLIRVVVMQVNDNTTQPESVASFTVEDDVAPVPTLPLIWQIGLLMMLATIGFLYLRRRSPVRPVDSVA
jgi:hypothetical protein